MKAWVAATVWLAMAAAGGPAAAKAGASPMAGPQSGLSPNGPIDISADSSTYVSSTCESTWSGAAEVLQGTSRLRADLIHAYFKHKPGSAAGKPAGPSQPTTAGLPEEGQSNCGPIDKIVAQGNVFYVTPDQVVHGQDAVYTADNNLIVMTGDVIVVQGKNVVRGDKMTLHTDTHQVLMDSKAKGRGTPNRVRAVLYSGQSGQPGLPGLSSPSAH